jgi:secondary thiamine-phosphate synthase enzyme
MALILKLKLMIQKFFNFNIKTNGQKLYELTSEILNWIEESEFKDGIINLSIQHTSASLIVQENADPDVQNDLLNYFDKLVPMNEKLYTHTAEGKDDMPAHIKAVLTNNQISLSIKSSKLLLGTWQGIYLFEHRLNNQNRLIIGHYLGN